MASVTHPILIFFDNLKIFFVDEHRNGGSWLPCPLPRYCKIIISFQQEEQDSLLAREEQDYLQALSDGGQNILHLDKFGVDTADSVLQHWLTLSKKRLTNYQMRVLQNVFSVCSVPLFCKLAFFESIKWRSYYEKDQTFLKNNIESSIEHMFEKVETKFNPVLVKHAFSYISASKTGVSECELEDILSLDDEVLNSIYQDSLPEIRRVPAIMVMKVLKEVRGFLEQIEADGITVFRYFQPLYSSVLCQYYDVFVDGLTNSLMMLSRKDILSTTTQFFTTTPLSQSTSSAPGHLVEPSLSTSPSSREPGLVSRRGLVRRTGR